MCMCNAPLSRRVERNMSSMFDGEGQTSQHQQARLLVACLVGGAAPLTSFGSRLQTRVTVSQRLLQLSLLRRRLLPSQVCAPATMR